MLSSSLFLRSSATLIPILSFFSTPAFADSQYTVRQTYQGQDFVNDFSFFNQGDPTNGYVTYSDKATSEADGRVTFDNGRFQMRVDSTTVTNPSGAGRGSVRIESTDTWTKGLFVADFAQLPERQCGIWPAWWTLGISRPWPYAGEIDILEGVHENNENLASLHTATESIISTDTDYFTGVVQTTNCNYFNGGGPTGCGILDRDLNSFGSPVGQSNARTVAMEWTSDFIKVWNFPTGSRPSDILSDNPDPSTWGTPAQQFTGDDVNIDRNFDTHQMIFDTTLCGDWAGNVWSSSGCAAKTNYDSCVNYVANNPGAFANTFWDIAVVKVYQRDAQSTSTTSTTSASSTSSTSTSSSSTSSTTSSTTTSSMTSSSTSSSTSSTSSSSDTTSSSSSTSQTSSSSTTSSTSSTSSQTSSSTSSDPSATTSSSSTSSDTTSTSSTSSSSQSTSDSTTSSSITTTSTVSSSITSTMSTSSTLTTSSTTTALGPIVTDAFTLAVNFVQSQRVKRQANQYVGFNGDVGMVSGAPALFSFDADGYLKTDQSFVSDDPDFLAQGFLRTPVRPVTPRFRVVGGQLVRDGGTFCALTDGKVIVYDGLQNKPVDCQDFTLSVQIFGGTSSTSSQSTSTTSTSTSTSMSSMTTSTMSMSSTLSTTSTMTSSTSDSFSSTIDGSLTTSLSSSSSTSDTSSMSSSTTTATFVVDPGNANGWGYWQQASTTSTMTLPTTSMMSTTTSISYTVVTMSTSSTSPTSSTTMTSYGTWDSWTKSTTTSANQWEQWQTTSVPSSETTPMWSSWALKQITTTITKTYVVPCPTGYETKTITVTTAYYDQATTTPYIPMTTYVTSCPPEWGFEGPVTVTIPVTVTKVSDTSAGMMTWDSYMVKTTKSTDAKSTWASWTGGATNMNNKPANTQTAWIGSGNNYGPAVNGDNAWSSWNSDKSKTTTMATGALQGWVSAQTQKTSDTTSTWASWNNNAAQTGTPVVNSWESVKPATASASGEMTRISGWETVATASSTVPSWEFWQTSTSGSAAAAATNAPTDGSSKIKTYTGEAGMVSPFDALIVATLFAMIGMFLM